MKRFAVLAVASFALLSTQVWASEESDIIQFCKPDVEKLCKGVPMGGGKILECLKKHQKEMTVGCAEALKKLKG